MNKKKDDFDEINCVCVPCTAARTIDGYLQWIPLGPRLLITFLIIVFGPSLFVVGVLVALKVIPRN